MENKPTKIHIIGPSGTGKTTLAEKLSEITGSPVIKLDEYVYDYSGRKDENKIKQELAVLLSSRGWITEGIYISQFAHDIFRQADQIVWMDFPLHINVIRVTKRFIKQKLTGKDKWGTISFLKLAHGTIGYSLSRSTTTTGDDGDINPTILENTFKPYSQKLVRIKNNRDYKKYLEYLTNILD